ncbi:hypothetical protein L6164_001361 [Bauhinia variegata]|uniref:Uncharacterized protein n=1 Tax=Bauhinia variegata TaxID=167791 RepID=A0ACB9Q9C9_BAUVA|nr:hypothetical protein L6164_001361 [Bauhinia variegata]
MSCHMSNTSDVQEFHGHQHHHHEEDKLASGSKLPEELAEEQGMKLYGFGLYHDPDHDYHHGHAHFGASELSGLALWLNALGCSLLFKAGAMLGDAYLHQLPHAFWG